jgi:8-oxo-dGTP pyrophosphatase MutT (NUDIX family)
VTTPAPKLRTDIVEVYVFRHADAGGEPQFLQLLRSGGPMANSWQPVMGHAEPWETAVQCALREFEEETGLARESEQLMALWALEQVHPYYIAELDAVVLPPRFAAEVAAAWEPKLNSEHLAIRWVSQASVEGQFMWPGQRAAIREILSDILQPSLSRDLLRIDHKSVKR